MKELFTVRRRVSDTKWSSKSGFRSLTAAVNFVRRNTGTWRDAYVVQEPGGVIRWEARAIDKSIKNHTGHGR